MPLLLPLFPIYPSLTATPYIHNKLTTTSAIMIPNAAIIFIVLVYSLSSVALAAGKFTFFGSEQNARWSPSIEQQQYMREVRKVNLKLLFYEIGASREINHFQREDHRS